MATPRLGNWILRPKDGSWALELTNGAYDGVYCFVQFVSRNVVVVKAIGTAARTRNPGLGAHRGRMTNEETAIVSQPARLLQASISGATLVGIRPRLISKV